MSGQLIKVHKVKKYWLKDNVKSEYVKSLAQATHIQQEEINNWEDVKLEQQHKIQLLHKQAQMHTKCIFVNQTVKLSERDLRITYFSYNPCQTPEKNMVQWVTQHVHSTANSFFFLKKFSYIQQIKNANVLLILTVKTVVMHFFSCSNLTSFFSPGFIMTPLHLKNIQAVFYPLFPALLKRLNGMKLHALLILRNK